MSLATQSGIVATLLAMAALVPGWLVPTRRHFPLVKLVDTPLAPGEGLLVAGIRRSPAAILPASSRRPIPIRTDIQTRPRAALRPRDPMAAPKIELGGQVMPPPPPPAALLPKQLIRTNVFSTGIPEPQTRAPEIKSGETGGFGDSGGLESRSAGGQPVTIAQLGGFDLPPGSGSGRTGLSQGGSRAGFAAEAEPRSETRPNLPAPVHPAGFGDAGTNAGTQARAEPAEITGTLPAEIISKPMPVYPDEARRLGIEGEVLLEVRFESTGKLQVVRVVRGLGHGLDEAAIHAARQIRFKPALRDGQPADSTGMLHISFQIA